MDIKILDESEIPVALRALRDVVASNGRVTPAERRFLEVIAELHGTSVDVDSLAPIDPREVARIITNAHARKRLVQLGLIAGLVEGEVTRAETSAVKALASALSVDEKGLKVLEEIAMDRLLLARFDMMRRVMGRIGGQAYEEEGLTGIRGPRDRVEIQIPGSAALGHFRTDLLGALHLEAIQLPRRERGNSGARGVPRFRTHSLGLRHQCRGRDPAGGVSSRLRPHRRLRVPAVRRHPVPHRSQNHSGRGG